MGLTEQQKNAISANGSDLLISAGAGSGKTFTLTERIIKKIIEDKKDIAKMLVVTFTTDASTELKQRIEGKLADALKKNPQDGHLSSQMIQVSSADISTIDSFLLKIVRNHFEKLNLDRSFAMIDPAEDDVLRRLVMDEAMEYFYESPEQSNFYQMADLFGNFTGDESFKDGLLSLYETLSNTPDFLENLKKTPSVSDNFMQSGYGLILKNQLKQCSFYAENFFQLFINAVKEVSPSDKAIKTLSDQRVFFENLSTLLSLNTVSFEDLKKHFSDFQVERLLFEKGVSELMDSYKDERRELQDYLKKNILPLFYANEESIDYSLRQNEKICLQLYDVLTHFEKEYSERKRKQSVCTFNDLTRYTLSLFYREDGSVSDIAREIADRYDEIYIDEYQDTNSVQDKIFLAISKNNRFMVGDIKQSIYRFRSAEPEIFQNYRTEFADYKENDSASYGKRIFMSDNFRCDQKIIDFSNFVSDSLFGYCEDIEYENGDRLICKKETKFSPIPCEIFEVQSKKATEEDEDADGAEENDFSESDVVVAEIVRLLKNKKLENGKEINPCDIAVLCDSITGAFPKEVENGLKKAGFGVSFQERTSLLTCAPVLSVINVLNAIDNPYRDEFLAGALCSPFFGFTLDELSLIRNEVPKKCRLYDCLKQVEDNPAFASKIHTLFEQLAKLGEKAKKCTSAEMILYLYESFRLLTFCKEDERAQLLQFYDFARAYEQKSFHGLYSFLKHIQHIIAQDKKEKQSSSASKNKVNIMTIHASKGLEYEVVFVSRCAKRFNTDDEKNPLLFHPQLGVSSYIFYEENTTKYNTVLRSCAKIYSHSKTIEEKARLFYVAMTRAKSKLYLTYQVKDLAKLSSYQKRDFCPYLLKRTSSFMDFILYICKENQTDFYQKKSFTSFDDLEQSTFECSKEEKDDVSVLSFEKLEKTLSYRYPYEYRKKIPSKLSVSKLSPQILDGTENEDTVIKTDLETMPSFLLGKEKDLSAERGTATHLFMQFCDFERLAKEGVESEIERLVSSAFISRETSSLIYKNYVTKFCSSELFEKIRSAKEVIREFRFNIYLPASEFSQDEDLKDEKVLTQGVTDCILVDGDGKITLIDYKTDYVTEENYREELLKRHGTQLSYYKKAVELMFEKEVFEVLIYSVPLAKTVEVK